MKNITLLILLTLCALVMSISTALGQHENKKNQNEQSAIICRYSISPTSVIFLASGGTEKLTITTADRCNWTAISSDSWLTITSTNNGNGNQTITYEVAPNTKQDSRTATITVEGQVCRITQNGVVPPPCLSLDPSNRTIEYTQATYAIQVNTISCSWVARTVTPWIHIISQDSGSVVYTVDSNTSNFDRSGSIEIEVGNPPTSDSRTHSVVQRHLISCNVYTVSPDSALFLANGGTGSFDVTAGGALCPYVVYTQGAVTIISGSSGLGSGKVTYSVPVNTKNVTRTAKIIVEGTNTTHTITQLGTGCTTASPLFINFRENGGTGVINVTADTACSWEASTTTDWITITSGSNTGNGIVEFTVLPNNNLTARTGWIIIGGQAVVVTQYSSSE